EEVRRGERDVDVARLADRLAAVERLRDGQLARTLLYEPSEPEQVLRALGRRDRLEPLGRPRFDLVAADVEPVPLADLDDVSRLRRRRVLPLERRGKA